VGTDRIALRSNLRNNHMILEMRSRNAPTTKRDKKGGGMEQGAGSRGGAGAGAERESTRAVTETGTSLDVTGVP
jgi:hypothetical protein